MAKDQKKEKKDKKANPSKEAEKVWAEIRKEIRKDITATMGEGWACHKNTVVGMGALGALIGVGISEGLWWVLAPGARGSVGHIASDVAGGVTGAASGTTGGLYLARNKARNIKAMNRTTAYRVVCEANGISAEEARKSDYTAELEKYYGKLQVAIITKMAKEDPDGFRAFIEGVAEQIGCRLVFDDPPTVKSTKKPDVVDQPGA